MKLTIPIYDAPQAYYSGKLLPYDLHARRQGRSAQWRIIGLDNEVELKLKRLMPRTGVDRIAARTRLRP